MYKVLIVDDEPIIREGLKTLISWEDHGFRVCGEAVNGRDGLNKTIELNPDLVIVDIKMPGIDGLQMINELRNRNVKCRFIILSGYSEFNYAQKAIELGIDYYVLKPIDKKELAEKVAKVNISLTNDKKDRDTSVISKEEVLVKIIKNKISIEELKSTIQRYGLDLSWRTYQVALVCPERGENGTENVLVKLKREIDTFLASSYGGYSYFIDEAVGLILKEVNFTAGSSALKMLQKRLKTQLGISTIIAVGKLVEDIVDLEKSLSYAEAILSRRFVFYGSDVILDSVGVGETEDSTGVAEQDKLTEEIYMAIDINGTERITELLSRKLDSIKKTSCSEEDIKASYMQICGSIINRILMNNKDLRDNPVINQEFLGDIYKSKSLKELNEIVTEKLKEISEELDKARPDSIINKIIDYINRNYSSDIKLDSIANIFNYSSSYLGKMFKSYTGESFNSCVEKVRIEKAKEFLDEGYKVYQVSEMVGYHDKDYFVGKFKKSVGVPPISYKNREK